MLIKAFSVMFSKAFFFSCTREKDRKKERCDPKEFLDQERMKSICTYRCKILKMPEGIRLSLFQYSTVLPGICMSGDP
jgi:hypothetical protein